MPDQPSAAFNGGWSSGFINWVGMNRHQEREVEELDDDQQNRRQFEIISPELFWVKWNDMPLLFFNKN